MQRLASARPLLRLLQIPTSGQESAAILSVLLNRRRLTVSLDWHCYKAGISLTTLDHYNRWPQALDRKTYADYDLWHGSDDEYADYPRVADCGELPLRDAADYYSIGKHLERAQLGSADSAHWIAETIRALQPLYEACHP